MSGSDNQSKLSLKQPSRMHYILIDVLTGITFAIVFFMVYTWAWHSQERIRFAIPTNTIIELSKVGTYDIAYETDNIAGSKARSVEFPQDLQIQIQSVATSTKVRVVLASWNFGYWAYGVSGDVKWSFKTNSPGAYKLSANYSESNTHPTKAFLVICYLFRDRANWLFSFTIVWFLLLVFARTAIYRLARKCRP